MLRWEVDFVDDRDDLQPIVDRDVSVSQGLGFDTLGRIDYQQRAFA